MRVLLISANREEINMRTWPLGLACVAAATKEGGHDVRLLDLVAAENPRLMVREAGVDFEPDIIGISVRNIDDQSMQDTQFFVDRAKEVVQDCRAVSRAPIVLGGPGYSMFPVACLDYLTADIGIQGEGESVFPALLDRIDNKADLSGLPGVYVSGSGLQAERNFARDLDRFPLPEPDLLYPSAREDEEFWLPVQTRRGCPMNCAYCSTATIEGCYFRRRSPAKVVQWLQRWANAGLRRFFFVDNTFNLPPSYARALCAEIIKAGLDITWRSIIYPKQVDAALADLMARAGCTGISLGFESGNEQMLHILNKRFKPDDIRVTSQVLADHGIGRMAFLLLGGPGETRESVEESFDFVESLNLDAVKITVGIRIYPYTALSMTAIQEGVISADDDLLFPKFYLAKGAADWIFELVEQRIAGRPYFLR